MVATLWSVDDDSTGLLMGEFYKGKSGETKSQALRDAQLAVKDVPRFEHPYYWGGIVLFGDWR